ncbi:UDP-glucose 4-epimerase GalE [Salinicola endophyticus]|uniref:UDP-glucose 4-epimerase n=1 Tax=Salinicola endophyticus TaxID=1949083 RepID=A0ABY8FKK8_9GAMM|nr:MULTISPECIES: UDP-glucose 4-epimerase GalE [Salinicola]WFF41706.1 UDP-glucose 4-epimerase GalE [Salinicola endophyticus]
MSKGEILVVGGAGYIGSHMVEHLHRSGYRVTVLDNLSTGHADAVVNAELVVGDLGDREVLGRLFRSRAFDAVMHFAALSEVGASMTQPEAYYQNNVAKTMSLLAEMRSQGVDKFVFSSTAAVYGDAQESAIGESSDTSPINPYGWTKRFVEQVLRDYAHSYAFRSMIFRYFNAAGADPGGRLGERHDPETHLIPLLLQAASGRRADFTLFGRDYLTPDGSCVRDFIHVDDLCRAHRLGLEALLRGEQGDVFNLGSGVGYSVLQVIESVRRVTGCEVSVKTADRRAGDPGYLVADVAKVERALGWRPHYSLDEMVAHAWHFETGRR